MRAPHADIATLAAHRACPGRTVPLHAQPGLHWPGVVMFRHGLDARRASRARGVHPCAARRALRDHPARGAIPRAALWRRLPRISSPRTALAMTRRARRPASYTRMIEPWSAAVGPAPCGCRDQVRGRRSAAGAPCHLLHTSPSAWLQWRSGGVAQCTRPAAWCWRAQRSQAYNTVGGRTRE